jgi:hypothetical protein
MDILLKFNLNHSKLTYVFSDQIKCLVAQKSDFG